MEGVGKPMKTAAVAARPRGEMTSASCGQHKRGDGNTSDGPGLRFLKRSQGEGTGLEMAGSCECSTKPDV